MSRLLAAAGVAAGIALVVCLPIAISDFRAFQFAFVGIYFIALLGLNVLTGYTGQISIGHFAFVALGSYTTAILVAEHGVKDLWTIPLAGLVGGVAGLLFGIPALRLSGAYLSLATFAVAVALPAVLKEAKSLTKGSTGINLFGLPDLTGGVTGVHVLGRTLTFNDWIYYLTWAIAGVLLAAAWLLLRGKPGRAFRAIRDSEIAAGSSGVNVAAWKILAFGISAFYAGVAGALYAIATTFVSPDSFPVTKSLELLIGVAIGGLGSLLGAVFGGLFIEFMPLGAQRISDQAPAVVYGVVLILVMFVFPAGAAGFLRRVLSPLTTRRYSRS